MNMDDIGEKVEAVEGDVTEEQAEELREIAEKGATMIRDHKGEDLAPTVIIGFHSGNTHILQTTQPDIMRSLIPMFKDMGIWDAVDYVVSVFSGWGLVTEGSGEGLADAEKQAEEIYEEYGSIRDHPDRTEIDMLQAYSKGVLLMRQYDYNTAEVTTEMITDRETDRTGNMMF